MFTQIKQLALAGSMVLLAGWDASAQQQLAQQHTSRYSLLQPFVQEGVLVDRSPISLLRSTRGLDPDKFSYSRQDTTTFDDFVSYYRLWQGASYQANRFPLVADTLLDFARRHEFGGSPSSNWQQRHVQNEVVLAGMHFAYREISEDAMDSMYVYYDEATDKFRLGLGSLTFSDTVFTNPNNLSQFSIQSFTRTFNNAITLQRWSVQRSFFMMAAHTTTAIVDAQQPVRFLLPSNLFFGGLTGTQLQIDLNDGQGFRNVQPGQTLQTVYNTPGIKYLRYRLLNADNSPLTQQTGVIVLRVGSMRLGAPTHLIQSNFSPCIQFPGISPGIGVGFVRTSPMNQGRIKKPFVLVEGFEGSDYVKSQPSLVNASAKGFGELNWQSISSGEFGPGNDHMSELTNFLDSINRAGYDIVFVDFITNRDRIEANALALASILQQINQQLLTNGSDANIELVGASMGGLIARVALRQMELMGCCHNVKLFTTYATPHLGANIPLALQHSLKDVGTRSNAFGLLNAQKDRYDHILNSHAARQMLIYHVEPSASQDRDRFVQLLQDQGLPREPRKSAVTNGSITGLMQKVSDDLNAPFIQPGMQLLLASAEVWVPNNFPLPHSAKSYRSAGISGMYYLRSEGFVMPHSPATASNAVIYKAGQGAWSNFADIAGAYITYATAMFKFGKMVFSTAIAAAANPPMAPGILAAGAIRATVFSLAVDRSLQSQLNSNILDNQNNFVVSANFPSLGVDYAPGDFQESESQVIESAMLTQRQFIFRFSFVNSASSLNQSNSSLLSSIDMNNFKRRSNSFEAFESFNSTVDGGNFNSKHVQVDFLLTSQIRANQFATTSTFKIQPSVQGTLNIARPLHVAQTSWLMNADVELAPWKVQSGGVLGINRNAAVQVSYLQNLPPSFPSPNFHFITKTSTFDCDSVPVVVENGGTMELGEIQQGNALTAEVYFRHASSLSLMSGSTLRINNRSRLIIEKGSTLFVHPGANIVLNGDSAILEIQGRVVLIGNASFTFSGSGFVRLNQMPGLATQRWSFGQGSSIRLVGAGRHDKVLEVIGEWRILDTASTFELRNGSVDLMASARINVHSRVNFENVHFTGPGTRAHNGVLVHGQPHLRIKNCLFTNGQVGLSANLLTYNQALVLDQVDFNNNHTGLETFGRSAQLLGCKGRQNHIFWRAYDIEGISKVQNAQIFHNQEGIHVMGQHGAQLEILESRLDSNVHAVMSFGDLKLKPYCSSFSNNTIGIYAGNTHVLMGGNANNTLRNNYEAIYLQEVDNLFLVNGYNDFSGSEWYITGRFTGIAHNYLSTIPNVQGYFINLLNNRMPLIQQQIPIDLEDGDGNTVNATNWTFMSSIPLACVRIATADYDYWVLSSSNSTVPVEIGGTTKTLPTALLDATQLVSKNEVVVNPQDLMAVQQFNQIFLAVRGVLATSLDKEEKLILDLGLTRMIEAVSNAYRFALLQPARGDEEFPVSNAIDWAADEIMYRMQSLDPVNNLLKINELKLQLAHVYRIGEYYKQSIELLDEIIQGQQLNSEVYIQALYWRCVCEAEERLVKGEIGADEFEQLRMPCLQQLPEARKAKRLWKRQELFNAQSASALELKLFPNPADDVLQLEQFADNGSAKVQVLNMHGTILSTYDWISPYSQLQISLESLPAGFYIVEVKSQNGKIAQAKFVKR